ncbi:hypothetical protein Hanom_Chr07g00672291 [Helianthus anomalus]
MTVVAHGGAHRRRRKTEGNERVRESEREREEEEADVAPVTRNAATAAVKMMMTT